MCIVCNFLTRRIGEADSRRKKKRRCIGPKADNLRPEKDSI